MTMTLTYTRTCDCCWTSLHGTSEGGVFLEGLKAGWQRCWTGTHRLVDRCDRCLQKFEDAKVPDIITDSNGEFYAVPGHVKPTDLLRHIFSVEGTNTIDWGVDTVEGLRNFIDNTTQGYLLRQCRWIPESWQPSTIESMVYDKSWPYEWEDTYLIADIEDSWVMKATYWTGP